MSRAQKSDSLFSVTKNVKEIFILHKLHELLCSGSFEIVCASGNIIAAPKNTTREEDRGSDI